MLLSVHVSERLCLPLKAVSVRCASVKLVDSLVLLRHIATDCALSLRSVPGLIMRPTSTLVQWADVVGVSKGVSTEV